MYTGFQLHHFRGFEDVSLEGLARINLLTGRNNVGKSAVLEGVFLHSFGGNIAGAALSALNPLRQAGLTLNADPTTPSPWDPWFHNFDASEPIFLRAFYERHRTSSTAKRNARGSRAVRMRGLSPEEAATLKIPVPQGTAVRTIGSKGVRVETIENSEPPQSFTQVLSQASTETGQQVGLQVFPTPPPPRVRSSFIQSKSRVAQQPLATRFSELKAVRKHGVLIEALQVLEPRLKDVDVLAVEGDPALWLDIGRDRMLPLSLAGEGMQQVADFVLSMYTSREGILLIDEIENGIHFSALHAVWSLILRVSIETNCQVFATTHSRETVQAAYDALSPSGDLHLFRLTRDSESGGVRTYDNETLAAALEIGAEVR